MRVRCKDSVHIHYKEEKNIIQIIILFLCRIESVLNMKKYKIIYM